MGFHTTSLHKAVSEGIERIFLSENFVLYWSNKDVRILNVLRREDIVTNENLLNLVHKRLLKIGRHCYHQHLEGQYPDHVVSPSALAYALKQGEFTPKEEGLIQYDHNETKEKFIALYEGNLIDSVFNQLTTEQKPLVAILIGDSDECFDCH